jgi:hypothetical protein
LSLTGDWEYPGTLLTLLIQFSIAMIPLLQAHILARLFETVAHLGVIWDTSKRFSSRILIRMMTRIMQIVSANGLPIIGERQEA